MIIDGNFDTMQFSKVNLKDLLEDDTFLRPSKKIDIIKEENIIFHQQIIPQDDNFN